jgi:hypothetical protein
MNGRFGDHGHEEHERRQRGHNGGDEQLSGFDPGGYSGYGGPRGSGAAGPFESGWRDAERFGEGRFGPYGGRYGGAYGGEHGARSTEMGGEAYRRTYAGRGPKGYRRSDERVLEEVSQALEDHPAIDASNVEVACQNGEIVLKGTVEDRRMKRLAESCIEELPGVKDVRNELRMQMQGREGASAGMSASSGSGGRSSGQAGSRKGTEDKGE